MYHCTYQVHASRMRQRRNATQYCTHQPPEYAPMQVAACTHAVQVCKWACSMVGWRSVACTPRPSKAKRCSLLSLSLSRFLFFSRAGSTAASKSSTVTRRPVPVPFLTHPLCHLPVPVFFCFVSCCALCWCCLALLLCVASLRCLAVALLWLGFRFTSSSSLLPRLLASLPFCSLCRLCTATCAQHSTAQIQTSQRRQWRRTRPSSFTIRRGSTR